MQLAKIQSMLCALEKEKGVGQVGSDARSPGAKPGLVSEETRMEPPSGVTRLLNRALRGLLFKQPLTNAKGQNNKRKRDENWSTGPSVCALECLGIVPGFKGAGGMCEKYLPSGGVRTKPRALNSTHIIPQ